MTGLTDIYLYMNSITDISPLVANTGLDYGDNITIWSNPLDDDSVNIHIPALQARGVNIFF